MATNTYIALAASRTIEAQNATWVTARIAASGTVVDNFDEPPWYPHYAGSYLTGGIYHILRHATFFDLSKIPGNATITAATLKLFVFIKGSNGSIHIVKGLHDNPVNANDYGDLLGASVSGGSVVVNNLTLNQYNSITLNATAISWLTPGQAVVKLALRGSYDVSSPSAPGEHDGTIRFYAMQKGAGYEPLLVLSFTVQYPSSSMTRVSSIRHICRPGFYRMQVGLGDLGFDTDVAEATVRKALDTAKEAEPEVKEEEAVEPAKATLGKVTPGVVAPTEAEKIITSPGIPGIIPGVTRDPIQDYLDKIKKEQELAAYAKSYLTAAGQPQYPPVQQSLWQKITPWKEEAGETFGSEFMERMRSFAGWVGGLFK